MNLYVAFKLIHVALGCVALVSFWTAGMARKGSPLHVGAGKLYLLSMAGLLAATVPMCWLAWFAGHQKIVVFLLYLLVISFTSVWLSWRAIRDKREDVEAFLARHGNPFARIGADNVSAIQFAIGSSGVPESFIIDGKGVIRYQHIGEIRPEDVPLILEKLKEAQS